MEFTIGKRYRLPYHGPDSDMRAVLEAGCQLSQLFGDEIPFCVRILLGRLAENASMGFGMERFHVRLSIPVTALGKLEEVHLDAVYDVRLKDADTYDETMDGIDISEYKDGTVRVIEYEGPTRWRREHWHAAEIQLSSHESAPEIKVGTFKEAT